MGVLWDLYRVRISIAFAIRSVDPIRSVDLSTRLIAPYKTSRCIETPSLAVKQNFPPIGKHWTITVGRCGYVETMAVV